MSIIGGVTGIMFGNQMFSVTTSGGLQLDGAPCGGGSGVTGPMGPSGATGPQGIQGPSGTTGQDGQQGLQGIQGIQGPSGVTGPQGPSGVTGPAGSGATGPTGSAGTAGSNGLGFSAMTRLTADRMSNSATVISNVTGLAFAVLSGQTYAYQFGVLFRTPATTTGLAVSVNYPASGIQSAVARVPFAADGAGGESQGWITASDDLVIGTGVQAANTDYFAEVRGVIAPTSSGTVQVRFRSEVASSAVTIRAGSYGLLSVLP